MGSLKDRVILNFIGELFGVLVELAAGVSFEVVELRVGYFADIAHLVHGGGHQALLGGSCAHLLVGGVHFALGDDVGDEGGHGDHGPGHVGDGAGVQAEDHSKAGNDTGHSGPELAAGQFTLPIDLHCFPPFPRAYPRQTLLKF